MKVLIADKFPEIYNEQIKNLNLDLIYSPKLGEKDLIEAAKDIDILVVRSTIVNAETIKNSNSLKIIIRAGSGVNNINIPAANEKNILVTNCPGKNSIAVAELAMGLIIALDRRIADNVADFKNSVWNKAEYSKSEGLFGKTLGLIGVGNIGKEVAKRALAFGMKVYGKDVVPIQFPGIEQFDDMAKVLPLCDIVSIHLPLNSGTRGLFNSELFDLLKPHTILINTSRAEIIDEDALIQQIEKKKLKVGLDVFKGEPEGKDGLVSSKLQALKNVYVTHHIGASTEQAQNAVAEETVRIISEYTKIGVVLNCVNRK